MFHGEAKIDAHPGQGIAYWLPLGVLLVFSTFIGGMIHPPLAGVLPMNDYIAGGAKLPVEILSAAVALGGIALAGALFLGERRFVTWLAGTLPGRLLSRLWLNGWGFDWLYDHLFVRPFHWFAHKNARDGIDLAILAIPSGLRSLNGGLVRTQTGRIRWYAASMALGAVLLIAAVILS